VDRVLLCLGNSRHHLDVPAVAAAYGGLVLGHEVRMTALQCLLAAAHPDPHHLSEVVRDRHGRHLGDEIRAIEDRVPVAVSFDEARARLEQANAYLLGPSIRGADALAVTSDFAARLADLELWGRPVPTQVLPFGHPDVRPAPGERPPAVIASFGMMADEKGPQILVEALAEVRRAIPTARLRFVGAQPSGPLAAQLDSAARRLGVDAAVTFVGRLEAAEYRKEMDGASVAVQLRTAVNGEMSAAIADCLASGIPTVVSNVGAQAGLSDDAVAKVPPRTGPRELARHLIALLQDPERRRVMVKAGQAHAAAHSFRRAAEALEAALDDVVPRGYPLPG
jgi:glycosyltransferase involved in cell wall biosynthesis